MINNDKTFKKKKNFYWACSNSPGKPDVTLTFIL